MRSLNLLLIATFAVFFSPGDWRLSTVVAQDKPWSSALDDLLAEDGDDSPEYTFSGNFTVEKGAASGTLNVVMDLKQGWHAYSQKDLEGQTPTTFDVNAGKRAKIVGPFVPNHPPTVKDQGNGITVEEFEGQVIWSAPIEIASDAAPEDVSIEVIVRGQVCSRQCIPLARERSTIVAKFGGYTQSAAQFSTQHGTIRGQLSKAELAPGEKATLKLTAQPVQGWHIYPYEEFKREDTTSQPTIIFFTKTSGLSVGEPVASAEPREVETGLKEEPKHFYHDGEVSWSIEVVAPADAKPGRVGLEGRFVFQFCSNSNCDRPTGIEFKAPITIVDSPAKSTKAVDVTWSASDQGYEELTDAAKPFWESQRALKKSFASLPLLEILTYLLIAFLAGLILNAMPCVLPVIGLKVMSFVQQAGENRSRIFLLNLVFSLGLLVVFWILATLSTFFGYGWGDWLTKSMTGSIIITAIVFAFGLSMLGVWEIPIPGLSGSNSMSKKSEEEGLLGAFFLGILTTVLATPCTGPLLIPAVTVTAGQPPWVAYLIFTTIGLGMALPYLLVGIFPSLIGWLPRPGAWMNTFKQITGFVLMATVVFLMSSFSSEPRSNYLVAMLTLLFCISFACWWIGRTSIAAETPEQLKAWGTGASIVAVGAVLAFTFFVPSKYELAWQPYSRTKLAELIDENRLVFIDFTGPN